MCSIWNGYFIFGPFLTGAVLIKAQDYKYYSVSPGHRLLGILDPTKLGWIW